MTLPRHPFFVPDADGKGIILRTARPPAPGTYTALDCESALIEVSNLTPEMVSVQISKALQGYVYGADLPSLAKGVEHAFTCLERGEVVIAHNGFYDWALMLNALGWPDDLLQLVTEAMSDGRIRDTYIRSKLHAIEMGWGDTVRFSLEALADRYCDSKIVGKHGADSYRLRYIEMRGIPAADWPAAAYEYAYLDPIWVEKVWDAMAVMCGYYPDEQFQTSKMWALHLASVWGITISQEQVEFMDAGIAPFLEAGMEECLKIGVYKRVESFDKGAFGEWLTTLPGGQDLPRTASGKVSLATAGLKKVFGGVEGAEWILGGESYWRMVTGDKFLCYSEPSKDMKMLADMVEAHWISVLPDNEVSTRPDGTLYLDPDRHPDKFTPTKKIKTDREILEEVPDLTALAEMGQFQKVKSTYLPQLRTAAPTLHPRHDPLKATGRNSASNPNINNVFKLPGVRECYVAREGYLIGTADYSQAELCSFAQVQLDLFGQSVMADRIREGYDLHLYLLYEIFGIPYEEAHKLYKSGDKRIKELRQYMKAPNFGLPGGMGVAKFLLLAQKQYKIPGLGMSDARSWKEGWMRTWPEAPLYLKHIGDQTQRGGLFEAVQHRSGRRRGGVGYADGANTFFQGLTADGAGLALINVQREAWLDKDSPIYGARVWGFVYDELLLEIPDRGPAANTACMARVAEIMKLSMEVFTPDVPATIEYEIARVWSKEAKATYNAEGLLIPWEYERKEITL